MDLAVRMTTSNEIVDLRSGEADVAIRAGGGEWDGLEKHRLFESPVHADGQPGVHRDRRAQARARKLEPRDIPDQTLISPSDDWWQQWFCDNGVAADESVRTPARSPAREPGQ